MIGFLTVWSLPAAVVGIALFFVIRRDLWRAGLGGNTDPRPAGAFRIAFGLLCVATWIFIAFDAHALFTDEGLYLAADARRVGGKDAVRLFGSGGISWVYAWTVVAGDATPLHYDSSPGVVYALYALMVAAFISMTLGWHTRLSTVVSWVLCSWFYRYNGVFQSGWDDVLRAFLFLGIFCRWGEVYSLDALRRQRLALDAPTPELTLPRPIPVWPQRLMMMQLAMVYFTAGVTKSGDTWWSGTALYYALNLAHFSRVDAPGLISVMQSTGLLPLSVQVVHLWEIGFPIVLIAMGVRAHSEGRLKSTASRTSQQIGWAVLAFVVLCAGATAAVVAHKIHNPAGLSWTITKQIAAAIVGAITVVVPLGLVGVHRVCARRHPVLLRWLGGRRTWLGAGALMHVGIDLTMNVGLFSTMMMSSYLVWLSARDVESIFHVLGTSPRERRGTRRERVRLFFTEPFGGRRAKPAVTVRHGPGDDCVRRAAKLRVWSLSPPVVFLADPRLQTEALVIETGADRRQGHDAAGYLATRMPELAWLRPLLHFRLTRGLAQSLALSLLGQRS